MSWRAKLEARLRAEAQPQHKYSHQPRLYALTREIAAATEPSLTYDDDVVFAAAFLHDLGVFIGHRPQDAAALAVWDHVAYACAHAPALLQDAGFPAGKLPHVLACIREHQPHDEPRSIEASLLRDADILEQLGAVAVLRTVSKVGSDTRFHTFADACVSLQRALEQLPGQLRLQGARSLATAKVAALEAFLQAAAAEGGAFLA